MRHPWVERAIMQALDGDGIGALPLLRRAMACYPTDTNQASNHPWRVIPEVVACVEQRGDVGALLHPLAEEAKERILIKPVRPRKPSVPCPAATVGTASAGAPGSIPTGVRRGR